MAQMYRIVPISFRDNTLTIALCDPQNLAIQDELRTFLGYDIRAVVATERDILKALDRYYAASGESVESLVARHGRRRRAGGRGRRHRLAKAPST